MKRNIQRTFIFAIFIIVVLISIWKPPTKAQSIGTDQTSNAPATNSYIYLPIILRPSCPATNGIRVQVGEVTTGSINTPNEIDAYYFCGTAGDNIRLDMSRTSGDFNPDVDIYRPDGTLLCSDYSSGSSLTVECTLDVSGTYTILAGDWNINNTGGYTFYLQRLNNPSNPTTINYSDVTAAAITSIVEHDTYTVDGTAGDIVRLDMSRTSGDFNPDVDIYRPDGTLLCSDYSSGSSLTVECTLDVSGTYTILAGDWNINDTGGYSLSLNKLN